MSAQAKLLRIYGKVQGVFYRDSMVQEARKWGVQGWVRNRSDESVEAFVQGDAPAVAKIVEWARTGSPQSKVLEVIVTDETPQPLHGFERRPTL